ncbi:MAG: hypothetical protein O7D33_03020 [Chloroflexi bacterium]|nr:hypothetical protein [Chloroflexota bacterium]
MGEAVLERVSEILAPYLRLQMVALAVAGLFVVFYLLIGAGWFLSQSSQSGLRTQIDQQRSIVNRAEARGEQVAGEYDRIAEAIPPASLRETDVFQDILAIAERNDVSITTSFTGEDEEQLGSKTYRALTFQASVSGLRQGILGFLLDMDETQELIETLIVNSASISALASGTLTMEFTVYTHAS